MTKEQFIKAVQTAIKAPSKSGTKWDELEKLFADNGLRGNGAINNGGGADRTTRVRQLATSKQHNGHDTRGVAEHSVFVVGGATIAVYDSDPERYEEQIVQALQDEHPDFSSCLLMKATPNAAVAPVLLVDRSDQPIPIPYTSWWPELKIIKLPTNTNGPSAALIRPPPPVSTDELKGLLENFQVHTAAAFLRFDQATILRLASCLLSKRLLIATGLAGSGKTKLAQGFGRWISSGGEAAARCCAVVPVGADWTGNENILGYPDGLQASIYVAKPALELILHASNHSDVPHFLILDEMNLSHVERYFADILSIIESGEGLDLYSGDMEEPDMWRQTAAATPVPPRLIQLPRNLFIIGTVNVDETTYMFSPKVLDRANVIEFRMDAGELEGFLANPAKPDLAKLDGRGEHFGRAFVNAAKSQVAVPADAKEAYEAEMILLFKALQAHSAEFGYRTAYEAARFMHFYKALGNHADDGTWFPRAFDCVVFQKLLPKLHGSRAKLGPELKKLWFLCVNSPEARGEDMLQAAEEAARSTDKNAEPSVVVPEGAPYPLSAEKIGRMWRRLMENGFASFAEA